MKKKALLTVEAALVFPIFIGGVMAFIYLLEVLFLQEEIQEGLTKTAQFSSQYFCILQDVEKEEGSLKKGTQQIINNYFLHVKLGEFIDVKKINESIVKGGFGGVSMLLSTISQEKNLIDIVAVYQIRFPLPIIKVKDFTLIQRVRTRGFLGLDLTQENLHSVDTRGKNEKMVYVAENGTVYHLNSNCTHLNLSIHVTTLTEVKRLRNKSGAKYKECEYCKKRYRKMQGKNIYITDYGDTFHYKLSCPGLKRTVYRILLSEVGDRKLCDKCRKGKK